MKKLLLIISIISILTAPAAAETIRLKNGMLISGSIVGQTEFILSVQTAHGTISINQREVDAILPDLHRVLMRGGGEFIGNVLDLDQFNLALKTDKGVVNLDVALIASMEIYDYGEAEKQRKFVERKIELEQQALKALPDSGASAVTAAQAAAGAALSTSGLSFDHDLEAAFPSRPAVVEPQRIYNYRLNTFQGEEIKETAAPATPAAPVLAEEDTDEQFKIKEYAQNFIAVNAGIINTSLKLSNLSAGEGQLDMGGTSAAFGAEYRRMMTRRLWLGGGLSFGLIPKQYATIEAGAHEMKITGQAIALDLFANYYLNPKAKTRFYLKAGGGGSFLGLDKNNYYSDDGGASWASGATQSGNNTAFGFLGGLGAERSVQDVNIGLEARAAYTSYSGDLAGSRNINYYLVLQIGWFF